MNYVIIPLSDLPQTEIIDHWAEVRVGHLQDVRKLVKMALQMELRGFTKVRSFIKSGHP